MDEVLSGALAPVLRDLADTGVAAPRIEPDEWTGDAAYPSAMLWGANGSGMGIQVEVSATWAKQVAWVADQVQEWAIEELWSHAPTNWPPCPLHPRTHPMRALARDGAAWWACPVDDRAVALIGSLAGEQG